MKFLPTVQIKCSKSAASAEASLPQSLATPDQEGPEALPSPGNLFEKEALSPHPRPAES